MSYKSESRPLDDAARAEAPGQFVQLSDGMTHYELAGPEDGPPVTLVHGFSTPAFIWDPAFAALADAGYRVLRYDLFGRGYSDRPDVTYDDALFDRQLAELLDALDFPRPMALAGLSMGGAIVARFTQKRPDQVKSLLLLDPAGLPMDGGWQLIKGKGKTEVETTAWATRALLLTKADEGAAEKGIAYLLKHH